MANTKKRDAYWRHRGSNAGPLDLQSNALPTELLPEVWNPRLELGSFRPQRNVITPIPIPPALSRVRTSDLITNEALYH